MALANKAQKPAPTTPAATGPAAVPPVTKARAPRQPKGPVLGWNYERYLALKQAALTLERPTVDNIVAALKEHPAFTDKTDAMTPGKVRLAYHKLMTKAAEKGKALPKLPRSKATVSDMEELFADLPDAPPSAEGESGSGE